MYVFVWVIFFRLKLSPNSHLHIVRVQDITTVALNYKPSFSLCYNMSMLVIMQSVLLIIYSYAYVRSSL